MKRQFVGVLLLTLGLVSGLSIAAKKPVSMDPLVVAPKMYSLLFENEKVRVMQVVFKPGEKIAKHSHPDHFVYVMEAGKLKISKPDGSSTENAFSAGQIIWIPAETHWAENTGTTPVRLMVTEIKSGAPAPGAPAPAK